MERLAIFPFALFIVFISVRLNLTYVGIAVSVGVLLPIVYLLRGKENYFTPTPGYAFLMLGLATTLLAHLVCLHYGISFETLDQDRSFAKWVRRLPYFGLVFLSSGMTALAIFIIRRWRP